MNKHQFVKIFTTCLIASSLAMAFAQGGPPGGAGGRPQMSPEVQKQMEAWQKWREKNPNIVALGRTVRGLERLESDKANAITPAQAKKILPILTAWRKKPVMKDAEAKKVNDQLLALVSANQKKILTAPPTFGRGGGGPAGLPGAGAAGGTRGGGAAAGGAAGGRAGGGAAGAGGAAGGRAGGGAAGAAGAGGRPGGGAGFQIPAPKEYNPLNPETNPMLRNREQSLKRYNDFITTLTAKSKKG